MRRFIFIFIKTMLLTLPTLADSSSLKYVTHIFTEKIGNQYYLRVVAHSHDSISNNKTTSHIQVPIRFDIQNETHTGWVFQALGFGEADPLIFSFDSKSEKPLNDIFLSDFTLTSKNLGIGVLGGGMVRGRSENDITIKKTNGAITMIGPAGTPFGIHLGVKQSNIKFRIELLGQPVIDGPNLENTVLSVPELSNLKWIGWDAFWSRDTSLKTARAKVKYNCLAFYN